MGTRGLVKKDILEVATKLALGRWTLSAGSEFCSPCLMGATSRSALLAADTDSWSTPLPFRAPVFAGELVVVYSFLLPFRGHRR